jgi:hypothetical protein
MESYSYLICFSIDPVEYGFICRNLPDYKEFKGFNVFNRYFDMLLPNTNAKAIADVWDGYYRITLAQFDSTVDPEQLRKQFELFHPANSNFQIEKPLFTTKKLDIPSPHFRLGHDFADEPVALYVTYPDEFVYDSILNEIKKRINYSKWNGIPKRLLHMNIRLYSNASKKQWTWEEIKKHGIREKVREHAIEFHHTTLQIIPSRETCQIVYGRKSNNPWWEGVTQLDKKCSSCEYSDKENEWKGVCRKCKQYERIKPIWSIPFASTVNSFLREILRV